MQTRATLPSPVRPQRRDAVENRDRVLAAAARVVARDGAKVPMATIAEQAGVGVATLYRNYPAREDLLAALAERSYRIVLDAASRAASSDRPAIVSLAAFLAETIDHRQDLILPLHGGPVTLDPAATRLRQQIRTALERMLRRGQRDGTIRSDVNSGDIIVIGAMLAQPLPHTRDWERTARRVAQVYLDGLATATPTRLSVTGRSRADRETAFGAEPGP